MPDPFLFDEDAKPKAIEHHEFSGRGPSDTEAAKSIFGIDKSEADPKMLARANKAFARLPKHVQDEMKKDGRAVSEVEMRRFADRQELYERTERINKAEGRRRMPSKADTLYSGG